MILVVALYHFITTKTVLGRHIYAVGGNPEAAQLSGINVKKITYFVFGSMSMLAALSGILFTSRLQSASTTAGTLFELDAIAAAYVGGVSAAGGVGKITGSIIGAFESLGLSFIISASPFSIPRANAGKLSVTKFNHNNWIGSSGTGNFNNILAKTKNISPILQDNRKNTNFLILL